MDQGAHLFLIAQEEVLPLPPLHPPPSHTSICSFLQGFSTSGALSSSEPVLSRILNREDFECASSSTSLQRCSITPISSRDPPRVLGTGQLCHCLAGHPPRHMSDGREVSASKVPFRRNAGDSVGQGWMGRVAVTAVGRCSYSCHQERARPADCPKAECQCQGSPLEYIPGFRC